MTLKSILGSRVTVAIATAAVCVAAGGGAYAIASGSATITVCVHKHGGALYKASKCMRGDSKLTWDKAGPPGKNGPAAIKLHTAEDVGQTANFAKFGPYTMTAACSIEGLDTELQVSVSGGEWSAAGASTGASSTSQLLADSGSADGQLVSGEAEGDSGASETAYFTLSSPSGQVWTGVIDLYVSAGDGICTVNGSLTPTS